MKAKRTEWCGGWSVPWGRAAFWFDISIPLIECGNSLLLSIARAGPLDRRSDQPGTGDGDTTRLRRIWHGQLFLPQKRQRNED